MAKDLELDALLGDVPDLGERQLARQRHAVRPALARPAHAAGVVDVRLGRDVQLELGPRAPDGLEQAPVLDDERIGATKRRRAHERERPVHLLAANDDVDGHVHARAREVRGTARALEGVIGKVVRTATSIEVVAHAAVNGIRPCGQRRTERLLAAGRRQKLHRHQVLHLPM